MFAPLNVLLMLRRLLLSGSIDCGEAAWPPTGHLQATTGGESRTSSYLMYPFVCLLLHDVANFHNTLKILTCLFQCSSINYARFLDDRVFYKSLDLFAEQNHLVFHFHSAHV